MIRYGFVILFSKVCYVTSGRSRIFPLGSTPIPEEEEEEEKEEGKEVKTYYLPKTA